MMWPWKILREQLDPQSSEQATLEAGTEEPSNSKEREARLRQGGARPWSGDGCCVQRLRD